MAVKIRLKRMGKIRSPFYRVVVVDARKRRDGRVIEEIGKYNPMEEPSFIEITSDRAQYWLGVGAQPTDQVRNLLQITGDWQKFKGLPGAEGRLKVKAGAEALAAAKADAIKSADAAAEKAKAAASAAKAEAEAAAAAEAAAEAAEAAAEEAAEAPESAGEEA